MTKKVEGDRARLRRSADTVIQKRWLAGVLAVASAALLSFVEPQATRAGTVYPDDILQTLRTMGLNPLAGPVRRGNLYVLHALDPYGVEMRIVADVNFGEILSIVPAPILSNAYLAPVLTSLYVPRADAGPRIIHVPDQSSGK